MMMMMMIVVVVVMMMMKEECELRWDRKAAALTIRVSHNSFGCIDWQGVQAGRFGLVLLNMLLDLLSGKDKTLCENPG